MQQNHFRIIIRSFSKCVLLWLKIKLVCYKSLSNQKLFDLKVSVSLNSCFLLRTSLSRKNQQLGEWENPPVSQFSTLVQCTLLQHFGTEQRCGQYLRSLGTTYFCQLIEISARVVLLEIILGGDEDIIQVFLKKEITL